jgi:hypothetical protein
LPPLPKLKIKLPGSYSGEEVLDLEEARALLNFDDGVITVEGKTVHSFDELMEIANRDTNKNKEFLQAALLQIIEGG